MTWLACSPAHYIGQFAQKELLQQPGVQSAQVGISLYDPVKAKYLYNWQETKYFVPASNTKLFTLYAGLKYLGDSLVGIRYRQTDTALFIVPAGDPTLLHPDFPQQPVIDLLKKTKKNIYLTDANWREQALGRGWAWDDYNDDYMPERSPLPVYGNVIRWVQDSASASFYSIPDVDWEVRFTTDTLKRTFLVQRELNKNVFQITEGPAKNEERKVPFITSGIASAAILLKDTVGRTIFPSSGIPFRLSGTDSRNAGTGGSYGSGLPVVHSRPTDSLLRPMMVHSDNFFAEQTLLMVSNERLGWMNDARIIDTLLKNDLKELPQRPIWVDGSGLSRNDLFTPQDFVWLLDKMKNEFGLDRMKGLLPTGGTGTLANYYKKDSGVLFAKTGSLTGVVALSGYLITKKSHILLFSILINNHTAGGAAIRKDIEKLIEMIRERY
jgi:D-alanyl-D-alanine carboxypeptidase/D-alanyl-D-alanine-endopeptidase (penicillin-binding protein 4)